MTLSSGTPFPGATFVKLLELHPSGWAPPLTAVQEGLDGRLFTDLTQASDVTPTPHFYVRTRASSWLPQPQEWTVRIGPNQPTTPAWLAERRVPLGNILLECAGNDPFGCGHRLLSTARWEGVLLQELLRHFPLQPCRFVMVSGFDRYPQPSRDDPPSIEGADWIFPLERLLEQGAALVTHMNGEPLERDHGAPVRLLMPGWYGCCSIKWLTDIQAVADDAPTTAHMRWFAGRTWQNGVPQRACDYRDAAIETAAMPVRFEQWTLDGRPCYRVVGLVWGGSQPARQLAIRFNNADAFEPVHHYQPPTDTRSWSFWYHHFVPSQPAAFSIQLQAEPLCGARLAGGYYRRCVLVTEV